MMKLRLTSVACVLLVLPVLVNAAAPSAAIRNILDQQRAAWNRGDLVAFVATYNEQCTLVGKEITHVNAHMFSMLATTARAADSELARQAIDAV